MIEPPALLHCAPMLFYAETGGSAAWTGAQWLFVDGKRLMAVPHVTICKNLLADEFILMHCDEEWNVLGASFGATVPELKSRAECAYRDLASKWNQFRALSESELREIERLKVDLRKVDGEYPVE